MRDLNELSITDSGDPVGRPAPTAATIAAFEARFGMKIPAGLLTLLRHANAGGPEVNTWFPKAPDRSPWSISRFDFLDDDRASNESLWRETRACQERLGKNALPFADDGGGSVFFIDIRRTLLGLGPASGCVKIAAHNPDEIVHLAPSFAAFIDALAINPARDQPAPTLPPAFDIGAVQRPA